MVTNLCDDCVIGLNCYAKSSIFLHMKIDPVSEFLCCVCSSAKRHGNADGSLAQYCCQ